MVTRIKPTEPLPRIYIAEWRQRRDLTQEKLAELVETTKATISRWEAGDRDPPFKAMASLASALNVHVPDLFYPPDELEITDAIGQLRSLPKDDQTDVIASLNSTLSLVKKRRKL
jgi:transcriptional regulator with XRE-family HTH domain